MPPILRPCALALSFGLPMSAWPADVAWQHWSQLPATLEGLPVFADLDGDGFGEIVHGSRSSEGLNFAAYALSVLGQKAGGELGRVISIPLPAPLLSLVAVRRPGHDDSILVTAGSFASTRLLEYTGRDLQLVRDQPVTNNLRLYLAADIDADGSLDLLGDSAANFSFGVPLVLDYATASVQWQGPEQTEGVTAVQLDADPALEIISRGQVGRIYDGATGMQEWAWPSGFGQSVVGGRFEADPLIPGFVSHSFNGTTVFRASPYSPLREFAGLTVPLTVFDADGDGRDELYATRQTFSDFVRISAQDGSVQSLAAVGTGAGPARLGRLQANGSAVAALASLTAGSFQPGSLQVFDLDAAQVRYQADYDKPPRWPSAFLQPQAAGHLQAASLIGRFRSGAQQYQLDLEVRDAGTGALVQTRDNILPQGSFFDDAALIAADIDGVAGDEQVVIRIASFAAQAALLDGATLQTRWQVAGAQSPLENVRIRGWTLADQNQDGVQDVIIATSGGFGGGVRLVALSGTNGALLWQSVTIADANTGPRVGLVAGEVDAQPGGEIVLAVTSGIYAFDLATGLSTWIVKPSGPQPYTDVVHWGSGDDCRIGVMAQSQPLRLLSCVDRSLLGTLDLPPGTTRVAPLEPQGTVLAAVAGGDLLVARDGGPFQPELTGLGEGLALNWPWALRSSPGAISMLLGSTLQLLRADMFDDALFASGFEVQP
jgi:hypothetical protein